MYSFIIKLFICLFAALAFVTSAQAEQYSKSQQLAMVQLKLDLVKVLEIDPSDKFAVQSHATTLFASVNCLRSNFPGDEKTANALVNAIEKVVYNNVDKQKKYAAFSTAIAGQVIALPYKSTGCRVIKP